MLPMLTLLSSDKDVSQEFQMRSFSIFKFRLWVLSEPGAMGRGTRLEVVLAAKSQPGKLWAAHKLIPCSPLKLEPVFAIYVRSSRVSLSASEDSGSYAVTEDQVSCTRVLSVALF